MAQVPNAQPSQPVPFKEPQPSVDRIDELARRVLTGDILLPQFQRDFVWKRKEVVELLDSIARNYPIGSLLLWQSRQKLQSDNKIADLQINLPKPDYPVNYLLDGQQRLSTICGALYWRGTKPDSIWNIAYDLRDKKFLHLDSLSDPPQHQVRMNKLSDGATFYKYVATLDALDAPDKASLIENADSLFNRFKDYKVATVTLGDMSIEDVAPIFERINSTGKRLTIVNLMRAATWSQDFDLIEAIDDVLESLSDKNFGGIDRKVVLRVLSASAGGGYSVESIDALRNHSAEVLKSATENARDGFQRAVDFLSTQIGIPGDSVIPYANQLVVLADIFRQLPQPNHSQHEAIKEWFWRSAISGYFSGWNTGNMSSDRQSVASFVQGNSNAIACRANKPNRNIWRQKAFRTDNAHAKTLAIMLAHHKPLDLLTGQTIDVGKSLAWTNSKEYHHFFPKAFLRANGRSLQDANVLANVVMLTSASNKSISDRAPSEYLLDVEKAAGSNLNIWLEANLLSPEAFEAAKQDDYNGFLAARADVIDAAATARASWGSG